MILVGLTGNIASGKSTVARMLVARGATLVDADRLAREAVRVGTPAYHAIVDRWGGDVLAPDGVLDRPALRERVFGDPDELEALNAIVHPEVGRLREARVAEARARGERVVVCDIPLLFEKGFADEFDRVILVDAPRPVRLERLVRDRGLRETDAMAMIAAQMPAELKRARADHVIDNVGSLDDLAARVDAVWADVESLADGSALGRADGRPAGLADVRADAPGAGRRAAGASDGRSALAADDLRP
jgi:dephospho-CoA kinase